MIVTPDVLARLREEYAALQKRIEAVLDCPGSMCSHCIEVLTGEIPPETTLADYVGPCTEFRRDHLYQLGCSGCGKTESEHRAAERA